MNTGILNNYIENLVSKDKTINDFCQLRYIDDNDQQEVIQNIKKTNIYKKAMHSSYFPKTLEVLSKRKVINYADGDNTIYRLLSWGSKLIEIFAQEANTYTNLKYQYEDALFTENYVLALKIIDRIEEKVCISIWSSHQKMLIYNLMHKKELAQEFIDKLLDKKNSYYFRLLMAFYSKMADSSIGFDDYNIGLNRFRDSCDSHKNIWKYFNYKLDLTIPKEIQGIKSALNVDEFFSFVDYYETYIETLQNLSSNERHKSLVNECVKLLSIRINDFRIKNLYVALIKVDDNIKLDFQACELIEYYTCGKYQDFTREIRPYMESNPSCFEIYNLYMKLKINSYELPNAKLWQEINNIYSFNYDTRSSIHIIGGYYKLFYGTSWKYKILSIMVRKLNYSFDLNILNCSVLNDSLFTPVFYQCIKSQDQQLIYIDKFSTISPVTAYLHKYIITGIVDDKYTICVDQIRWRYYEVKPLINAHNYKQVIIKCNDLLEYLHQNKDMRYEERVRRILFDCYLEINELNKAMDLYVESFLITEELVIHMDLGQLIKILDSQDNEVYKGNICKPVIYYLYYRIAEEETTSAYLDYLDNRGFRTIGQLLKSYNCLDEKDVLFLYKVCTQPLLMRDYVSKTESKGSAAELRAEVLRVLINFDNKCDRTKEYINELNSIYKENQLQKKIDSFNHNRIFIDTENLYLYMKKDLESEFIKYKTVQDLKKAISINKDKSLDIEQRLFLREQYLELADFILSIVEKIKKQYLNDSPYSLECFLSTRIRHNFCNDNLKKAFESQKLFSKKAKDNSIEYIVNEYWRNKLNVEEYNLIIDELSKFSQTIDYKIQEIKDKWMRIKHDERSEGMFNYIKFTQAFVSYYVFSEEILNNAMSFFNVVIQELNIWTEEILEKIREIIETDLKAYYNNAIINLDREIKKIEFNNTIKSEMLRNIELTKVQFIDDIEMFKDIFNMEQGKYPDFTMEELVEFCSEVEKEMNNKFKDIKLNSRISIQNVYCGSIFPYLVDIIGILIRNAVEHSQITQMDELSIGINVNPYNDSNFAGPLNDPSLELNNFVIFKVTNNLKDGIDEKHIREKVQKKIDDIHDGNFTDQSIREGGSGLYKTARTIFYGLHSPVVYSFDINNGVFEINIAIDLGPFIRKDIKDENALYGRSGSQV